jgi:DNA-binding MarR family transcriptional regulator
MAAKSRLAAQADHLSRLTRELARCCQAKDEQIFGQFGLSSAEGRVLLCVAEGGKATPSAVAEQLHLGRSRLTPLVASLVRKGFLTHTEPVQDRRVRALALTGSGQKTAQEVLNFQISFHEELLRNFDVDERRQLLEVLDHLHEVIEISREKIAAL